VNEFAERVGVKPSTVRRWIFEGRIAVFHIGWSVRIPAEIIPGIIRRRKKDR
jgi:excisionase family DNA binding protein